MYNDVSICCFTQDREKAKEDKRNEKIMERDRKMEQRRLEMEIARELRKPVEDMIINNHQVNRTKHHSAFNDLSYPSCLPSKLVSIIIGKWE